MTSKAKILSLQNIVRQSTATRHNQIVAFGLLSGLFYLPTFTTLLVRGVLHGHSTILLNAGFLYIGLSKFWENRSDLSQTKVLGDDRMIGHSIIIGGAFWLPFCRDSSSLQALVWMLILVGIAWSSFSPRVFGRFPLSCLLILIGVFPDLVFLSNQLLRALTGPYFFEDLMAWAGGHALRIIGQPAITEGRFLRLPEGSVEVASGCTGFDMAFALVGISFILGLLLKQSWQRIVYGICASIAIALILNVPRIVLLAFAAVYWGKDSFDFWHGLWGGQIFSTLMFTVYYYAIVAIYRISSKQKPG